MRQPYLSRKGKREIGVSGVRSEDRLALRLGARKNPASGAKEGAKGDMKVDRFLLEAKSSTGASVGLQHEWLAKITREALDNDKQPALAVTFVNGDGSPKRFGQWVMVPEHVFKELLGE